MRPPRIRRHSNRMDFIYWRHITPVGVKVEEISGGEDRSQAVRIAMARQIYCENGRDGQYRSLLHLQSGAPLLENEETRISITHTPGLYAVASLPKTPDADLTQFAARTALGIDAERADREQALRVRERFLSDEELALVGDGLERTIIAWTAKEALYKAALAHGTDWRRCLRIISLPGLDRADEPTPVGAHHGAPAAGTSAAGRKVPIGKAELRIEGREVCPMELYSYRSGDHIITLAYSPGCAKYKKG